MSTLKHYILYFILNYGLGYLALVLYCLYIFYVLHKKQKAIELLNAACLVAAGLALFLASIYFKSIFNVWVEGDSNTQYAFANRIFGPHWPEFWTIFFIDYVIPQLLWFRKIRKNIWISLSIAVVQFISPWKRQLISMLIFGHKFFSEWTPKSSVPVLNMALVTCIIFIGLVLLMHYALAFWRKKWKGLRTN